MYTIALKMLFGDRLKYLMLVSAIAFSSLLMAQQSSVFTGLMLWTTATLQNTNVPIWVMDTNVEQVNEVRPLVDTDLSRVRSVPGVSWAVPFYFSVQQARLYDGRFKSIQLFGVDSTTLIGVPREMIAGNLDDLRQADAVIIDEVGVYKLSGGRKPLAVGDSFEINDHEARVVGICVSARSFSGNPYVYTTYERALEMVPPTRSNLSFILVEPMKGVDHEALAKKIRETTKLKALTNDQFFWSTIWWYVNNTGIPISFGTTIFLGFIVGFAVSGPENARMKRELALARVRLAGEAALIDENSFYRGVDLLYARHQTAEDGEQAEQGDARTGVAAAPRHGQATHLRDYAGRQDLRAAFIGSRGQR